MAINFKERAGGVESSETATDLYQDSVTYPCFSPTGIRDESGKYEREQSAAGISLTDSLLQRMLDVMGGGAVGGTYRSLSVIIPPLEQRYEIPLGIYATQISVRCDKPINLILNNPGFDNIFLEIADFPISISQLRMNESIHTLYVTTGDDETTIKIIAFGSVKQY